MAPPVPTIPLIQDRASGSMSFPFKGPAFKVAHTPILASSWPDLVYLALFSSKEDGKM